jgi:hypothetical protein
MPLRRAYENPRRNGSGTGSWPRSSAEPVTLWTRIALGQRLVGRRQLVSLLLTTSIAVGACGPTHPSPSPTPFMTTLNLVTELASCGFVGGCAAYGSIALKGATNPAETRLSDLGSRHVTQGLPGALPPGSYVVRFRLVALSDLIVDGEPASETTVATCSEPIAPETGVLGETIEITVIFRDQSCEIRVAYEVIQA